MFKPFSLFFHIEILFEFPSDFVFPYMTCILLIFFTGARLWTNKLVVKKISSYPLRFLYILRTADTKVLRCIGYLTFMKIHIHQIIIVNSSPCTTTKLSKLLASSLIALETKDKRYCEKYYERSGKDFFRSVANSGEVVNKLMLRVFRQRFK